MTDRATEKKAAIALRDACDVLGIPCAYDERGQWLAPEDRPDGYHAIDYAAHYGGAYLYRSSPGGGQREPATVLRRAGFSAGGLGIKRWPLRRVIDTLRDLTVAESIRSASFPTKRAAYMAGAISHAEYYGLLVDYIGERALVSILPGPHSPEQWRALLDADENLNNVALQRWDALHPVVFGMLRGGEDLQAITGPGGWSMSDSVCVLKAAARRAARGPVTA